jgi:hypothetical protein
VRREGACRWTWGLAALASLGLLAACVTRQPLRAGQEAKGLDPKLSTHAYLEEGDLVTLAIDTRPARDKDGQAYVPFEIAIANHGLRVLSLTLESFTLVDEQGNRYPAAVPQELLESYDMLDFDRALGELEGILFNRFAALQRYPSKFCPTRTAVTTSGPNLVRDLVALPKHGYLIDFIYFPAPKTGIRDRRFDLFVSSAELPDPVFVKFAVR